MRALLGIAGLAAIVGYCFYRAQGTQQTKTEAKEDVRRWEGEGGNVPAVATPSPVVTPQSSYPAPESEARH
jgi:hypothetical protein